MWEVSSKVKRMSPRSKLTGLMPVIRLRASARKLSKFAALGTEEIQALTTAQMGALTTDQIVAFTTTQMAALETADIRAMSMNSVATCTLYFSRSRELYTIHLWQCTVHCA